MIDIASKEALKASDVFINMLKSGAIKNIHYTVYKNENVYA